MALIGEKDREAVVQLFSQKLEGEVTLVLFTYDEESAEYENCQFCGELEQLLEEVASMSDKLDLVVYDFDNEEVREKYSIERAPAVAVVGEKDYGIRYYGIPSGYEARSVIEDIIDVSAGKTDLSEDTLDWLAGLNRPVHLKVFVTPTCPYCPSAVRTAHQLAFESDMVTGDMIEAMEFPELSRKYNVYGVPRVVINDNHHFEGALPEKRYVAEIRKALLGLASLS